MRWYIKRLGGGQFVALAKNDHDGREMVVGLSWPTVAQVRRYIEAEWLGGTAFPPELTAGAWDDGDAGDEAGASLAPARAEEAA